MQKGAVHCVYGASNGLAAESGWFLRGAVRESADVVLESSMNATGMLQDALHSPCRHLNPAWDPREVDEHNNPSGTGATAVFRQLHSGHAPGQPGQPVPPAGCIPAPAWRRPGVCTASGRGCTAETAGAQHRLPAIPSPAGTRQQTLPGSHIRCVCVVCRVLCCTDSHVNCWDGAAGAAGEKLTDVGLLEVLDSLTGSLARAVQLLV